jgi:hypothetical protein
VKGVDIASLHRCGEFEGFGAVFRVGQSFLLLLGERLATWDNRMDAVCQIESVGTQCLLEYS